MQAQFLGGNPFAILTAIVAPAILTNASSVLALGTGNRLGRVVDRTRVVANDVARFARGSSEREAWTRQLSALQARAQLLLKSLRLFYAGLGLFAASALVSVGGSISAFYGQRFLFELTAVLAVVTGASAVFGLVRRLYVDGSRDSSGRTKPRQGGGGKNPRASLSPVWIILINKQLV